MPNVLKTVMHMYSDLNYDTISFFAVSGDADIKKVEIIEKEHIIYLQQDYLVLKIVY